jgi:hypothetical protein
MRDALPRRRLHALLVAGRPDARMDELLRSTCGEAMSVLQGDEMQHHVQCRGAARAGQAIAVDDEQAAIHFDLRKGFAEGIQALPMRGGTIAVEQSRPRQEEAAGVDGAEIDVAAVEIE